MFKGRVVPNEISSVDLRAVYDARFRADSLRDADSFYAWICCRLQPEPGMKLADVACGSGRLLYHAGQAGLQAIGIDFSAEALKLARAMAPQSQLVLADGQSLPLADNSIDYVTSLGSLEHYVDPDLGAREIMRILRPNGLAAVVLPNAFYAADLVWWVWRKGRSPSHHQPLERFAAYEDWADLLERNGLRICTSLKYNFMFPRSRLDLEYYRRFPRKLLNLAVSPLIPFNFSYSFLYLCQKVT